MRGIEGEKQFEEWARYANEDIIMAGFALEKNGPPNQMCFHSQQAAEKYLKGFLIAQGREFDKSHLLRYLLELCEEIDNDFMELRDDVIYLTQFYIETRYPGDIPEFSFDEGKQAFEFALRIKEFVLRKMKQ